MRHASLPSLPRVDARVREALLQARSTDWFEACFWQNAPGRVPGSVDLRAPLVTNGLIDEDGTAAFRINFLGDRVFITDGPWSFHFGGVFPWADESAAILGYLRANVDAAKYRDIIDLASGCGHTTVGVTPFAGRRTALDISRRASHLATLNGRLNECPVHTIAWDIRDGIPAGSLGLQPPTLCVGNFPHALVPPGGPSLPQTVGGGRTGMELTATALIAARAALASPATLVFFSYTLCDSRTRRVSLVEEAKRTFPSPARVAWSVPQGIRIWRVNGEKTHPNPMPLGDLEHKADCRLSFSDDDREEVRVGYRKLALDLADEGWDQVAAGILTVEW